MCGRYSLALSNEELYDGLRQRLPQMFARGDPNWERPQDYRPNYNMAPRQRAPIIHRDRDSGTPIIETMQWGLIPHWTKHPPTGAMNTINARSEALLDPSSGGMWHALKTYKRCIVPAQGYYEWHKRPAAKIAHFTRLPLGSKDTNASPPLMFFAGLYDHVKYVAPVESRFQPREGDTREPYPTGNPIPLATYTILTTTPAKDIEWLHDRMPCILNTWDEVERWLDLGEVKGWEDGKGGTGDLLHGTPGLDCFPVPPEVGKIGTNSPTYIQPVSERSDGIKSFFQKQSGSPAKIVKKETPDKPPVKDEKADVKAKAEEIETKIEGKEAVGLGDDSKAPNPSQGSDEKPELKEEEAGSSQRSTKAKSPVKRKRAIEVKDDEDEDEDDDEGPRKGGHQTKVVRHTSDEKKEQPSITNFFKSPDTKAATSATKAPAKAAKKGRKK